MGDSSKEYNTMAKQQVAKALYIAVRYFVKRSGSVCCKVVSGEKKYTTCVHANGRTSCTCDAGQYSRSCKHVKLVVAAEQARKAAPVAVVVTPVEIRETDGLDNSAESWKLREKRAKERQAVYVAEYNAKLEQVRTSGHVRGYVAESEVA
jgi:hypothetical protein